MTQVDADVLLIDEVLAVGDASFQQKCFDVFARLHAAGKTIILVTHDMASVETHCDRAILLEAGRIDLAGDPADVARRYLELNFPQDRSRSAAEPEVEGAERARIEVRLADDSGEPATSFAQGERIGVEATVEVLAPLESGVLRLQVLNGDGLMLSAPPAIDLAEGGALSPGDRLEVRARLANPLAAGHYYVNCGISRGVDEPEPVAFRKNAADFVVFGTRPFGGLIELEMEAEVEVDESEEGS
jgi:ABC-2 type transport system ATP-binding protein